MISQKRKFALPTIEELLEEEEFLGKTWDDFAHTHSLLLGPQCTGHPTQLILNQHENLPYVLQSCARSTWTEARAKLVEIGRKSPSFVKPRFMFSHKDTLFVGSEVVYCSDGQPALTLADIIDCTMPIGEIQVAAVLQQIVPALLELEAQGLEYGELKASNIFPDPDGKIRLSAFGPRLQPTGLHAGKGNSGCEELGYLANHMISRVPRLLGLSQTRGQKLLIQTESSRIEVDVDRDLSVHYFDFLETCMGKHASLTSISKHRFIRQEVEPECLRPNIRHAEMTSLRY